MSIAGIASNFLLNSLSPKQTSLQQFKQEFQQMGQDLQAGNLKAAQDDYAQLQQIEQKKNSSTSQTSTSSVSQLFDQLGKDLASGNTSSAQDDFNDIVKAVQSNGPSVHHHHHHGGGGSSAQASAVQTDLNSLGQALQSGNLSAAQAAYTSVQTDLQSIGVVSSGAVSATA